MTAVRDPRRVERAHPAVRAPGARTRARTPVGRSPCGARRTASTARAAAAARSPRRSARRALEPSPVVLVVPVPRRDALRRARRAEDGASKPPRHFVCRSKPRRRAGRRRLGPTRPRPWARHGDDSDCFYCGDFDSEEEIAHNLDLNDESSITKSWALVLEVCERHARRVRARGARARAVSTFPLTASYNSGRPRPKQ